MKYSFETNPYLHNEKPYKSIKDANSIITKEKRFLGLILNINGVDYWYAKGLEDNDLTPVTMETQEREELIKNIDSIRDRVTAIDKEREGLVNELQELLPIKIGDKVQICNREGDVFVRFAFVNKIELNARGKERRVNIEFDLQKCRADGTISSFRDYLTYNEYVTKFISYECR